MHTHYWVKVVRTHILWPQAWFNQKKRGIYVPHYQIVEHVIRYLNGIVNVIEEKYFWLVSNSVSFGTMRKAQPTSFKHPRAPWAHLWRRCRSWIISKAQMPILILLPAVFPFNISPPYSYYISLCWFFSTLSFEYSYNISISKTEL